MTAEKQVKLQEETREWLALINSGKPQVDKIDSLRDVLRYHEWRYYVKNDPLLSDYDYDRLFKVLQAFEQDNPTLVTEDSPTQRVGSDLTHDFQRVSHLQPMLSLANSYNAEDLIEFDKQVRKKIEIEESKPIAYTVEPKFDGGSISLLYENDRLVRAATRGNGQQGDDITPNARSLKSVPLKAAFSQHGIHTAEIRCEAVIPLEKFIQINKTRLANGDQLFANPRNAATGGLRTKDSAESAARGIVVYAFSLAYAVDDAGNDKIADLQTHQQALQLLQQIGFLTPEPQSMLCKSIEEASKRVRESEQNRANYPYEIDGMVLKVNRLDWQALCGFTSHHPRWAIAYKFKAKQAVTRLLDIEYQVGKVGSVTPVAKVEAVQLAGVTISSISLHNEDFITSKDIRIGDQVLIERAGDVIPYIVKSLPEMRSGSEKKIEYPQYCPINEDEKVKLVRMEGEAAWRCPTCTCGAQPLQRLIWHVSKNAMDIDGLGKASLERFWELGWIRSLEDIYSLDYEMVAALDGFGKKSAQNLKKSIDKAKQNPIYRLLHSLSIHHLGKRGSRIIAEKVSHVLNLQFISQEELEAIKDIGPILAGNVVAYFSDSENIRQLKRLEELGVNLAQTDKDKPPTVVQTGGNLSGKSILFTGTLQHMSRQEAQQLATSAGARVISAVSSKLDILVVGEKAGSKLRKAEALGTVDIWTEEAFLKEV